MTDPASGRATACEVRGQVTETLSVVLVEPYLQGTSAMWVREALRHTPHRLLSIGVRRIENRHYGTPEEHDEAHCLDAISLRQRIGRFLGAST